MATLIVVYAVNLLDRTIVNVLVEPIKRDLQLTDTQVGLIAGPAFGLIYAVAGLPLARLAERTSRLDIIAVSVAIWSAMTAACAFTQSFWQFFAARFGVGVGEAGCTPAAHSTLSDLYPPAERPVAMSLYSAGSPLGILVGAMLGGWIGSELGWRAAFLAVGVPGLILALGVKLLLREPARGATERGLVEARPLGLKETLGLLWASRPFRYIAMAFAFAATAGYGSVSFLVPFLQRAHQISLIEAGFSLGLISGLGGMTGMVAAGALATRLSRRDQRMQCWVPGLALIIAVPPMTVGLLMERIGWQLGAVFAVAYSLSSCYIGLGFAAAHNIVDHRIRATASGVLLFAHSLIGLVAGPTLTGMGSDIATRFLYGDDFDKMCKIGEMLGRCATSQADGLRYALVSISLLFAVSGLCFLAAGANMTRKSTPD